MLNWHVNQIVEVNTVLLSAKAEADHQSQWDAETDKDTHHHQTNGNIAFAKFIADVEVNHAVKHAAAYSHECQGQKSAKHDVDEIQYNRWMSIMIEPAYMKNVI